MRQRSGPVREPAEQVVTDIRRAMRRHFLTGDKVRIVMEGLVARTGIADALPPRRIVQNLYYRWSKEFWCVRFDFRGRLDKDGERYFEIAAYPVVPKALVSLRFQAPY